MDSLLDRCVPQGKGYPFPWLKKLLQSGEVLVLELVLPAAFPSRTAWTGQAPLPPSRSPSLCEGCSRAT
jgi:hypothetical protein